MVKSSIRFNMILAVMLIVIGITASACASSNPTTAQQSGIPDNSQKSQMQRERQSMNLTPEQVQQMMQKAIGACDGLELNEICTLQTPTGNRTGNCQVINSTTSTLYCTTHSSKQRFAQ